MSVKVTLSSALSDRIEGLQTLHLTGETVGEVLRHLCGEYPALTDLLWRDGEFNSMLVAFRNNEDIRHLQGLNTPLSPNDELSIITAIEGGLTSNLVV